MGNSSIFEVNPDSAEPHGAAVLVVPGIADILDVRAELQADGVVAGLPRQLCAVEHLENLLVPVAQSSVTQQEATPAGHQIVPVRSGKSFGDGGDSQSVLTARPVSARNLRAHAGNLINFSERETLRLAIVPPEAHEQTGLTVIGERLLEIDAGSRLVATRAVVRRDIRHGSVLGRNGKCFSVDPHARCVPIRQQTYDGPRWQP